MWLTLACREAIKLSPLHFRALKLLGSALYALGDLQGACTALQSALQLNDSYADAHCDLGCVLCALGRVPEAKEAFQHAARLNPKHVEVISCYPILCTDLNLNAALDDICVATWPVHSAAHI